LRLVHGCRGVLNREQLGPAESVASLRLAGDCWDPSRLERAVACSLYFPRGLPSHFGVHLDLRVLVLPRQASVLTRDFVRPIAGVRGNRLDLTPALKEIPQRLAKARRVRWLNLVGSLVLGKCAVCSGSLPVPVCFLRTPEEFEEALIRFG